MPNTAQSELEGRMVHVTDTRGIDSAPNGATPNGPETDARGGDSESEAMPGIRTGSIGRLVDLPMVDMARLWADRHAEVQARERAELDRLRARYLEEAILGRAIAADTAARARVMRVAPIQQTVLESRVDSWIGGEATESLEELLADIPEPVPQSESMPTDTYDDAALTKGQLAYMTTIIAQVTSTMRYQALRGSYSKHSPERIVEDFAHALARELDGNYSDAFNPANFLEQAGY